MKKSDILLLLIWFSALFGCQRDIDLVGEAGKPIPSSVFIRSITLFSFPDTNPTTSLPWDEGAIQPFDSLDFKGPDIFYSLDHKDTIPPPNDTLAPFLYQQATHFQDVLPLPSDTPLVYHITDSLKFPKYYYNQVLYLKIYDFDFGDPPAYELVDSIGFFVRPDTTKEDKFITTVSGHGFRGSFATLELEWK